MSKRLHARDFVEKSENAIKAAAVVGGGDEEIFDPPIERVVSQSRRDRDSVAGADPGWLLNGGDRSQETAR